MCPISQPMQVHIFMEYMDGGSLDRVQTRVGRVPEPILTTIAVRVVGGLKYLWDQHTALHRDIKPANILVVRVYCRIDRHAR
eukprot:m.232324 g.232324  ORF g.232324 m.232324 type:complete len:82 (-) comp19274_c0_seq3:247-492(-)